MMDICTVCALFRASRVTLSGSAQMNLEEDLKGAFCFLKGDVVCLSVLLYEWSRLKERRDVINGCLVLLQLLREFDSSDGRQRKVVRDY